jgi:hypothetical protein
MIVLAAALIGLVCVGMFVLGMLLARYFILDAQESAKYDRLREEYFRLAGVSSITDPKPYVPPKVYVSPFPRTPRNRILPGMGALDRRMKEGKRGVIMWRPSDRRRAG